MIGDSVIDVIRKALHIDIRHIPDKGKFIVSPTRRTIYKDIDGCPYAAPADTVYKRDFRWEQNHYTVIVPGLTEWAERYRQAADPTTGLCPMHKHNSIGIPVGKTLHYHPLFPRPKLFMDSFGRFSVCRGTPLPVSACLRSDSNKIQNGGYTDGIHLCL